MSLLTCVLSLHSVLFGLNVGGGHLALVPSQTCSSAQLVLALQTNDSASRGLLCGACVPCGGYFIPRKRKVHSFVQQGPSLGLKYTHFFMGVHFHSDNHTENILSFEFSGNNY